jgi:superfamily II DNA/RNA helicase
MAIQYQRRSHRNGNLAYSSSQRYKGGRGRAYGAYAKRKSDNTIDVSRLVNKAVEVAPQAEYIPEHKFNDFQVDERLKQNIIHKGFVNPSPIQDQSIEQILAGKDLLGIANTGTGKTAAFLIPLIDKVAKNNREKVLIVVPTRELALQIEDEFKQLSKFMHIWSVLIIGGASMGRQIAALRRNHNFVIGTPGRLKDLADKKILNLSQFRTVVLDEVDRMLDMGFVRDVKYLMSLMATERQSLFFSATLSNEIDSLIRSFLKDPIKVSVKTRETATSVDQDVVHYKSDAEKIEILHDLLIKDGFNKVLIFGKTKHGVRKLAMALHERGFKVQSLHGDKTQAARQEALSLFKRNDINILIATDVAARGLDVADITHVINYDMPNTYEDYVHRIGRTGRANKKGQALTFVHRS